MQMLPLLLLSIASVAFATSCPGPGTLNEQERTDLVKAHNNFRRKIANGNAQNNTGKLSVGKNMYRMGSERASICEPSLNQRQWEKLNCRWTGGFISEEVYDCDLEKAVVDALTANCDAPFVNPAKYGQNVQVYDTPVIANLKKALLADAVKQWYQPVISYGLSTGNKYDDARLYTFANLAYDRNTAFGCHYAECQTKVVISCLYSNVVPENAVLYEQGTPCTKDDECTLYNPSTCSNGLCIAKPVVVTASPPPGMSSSTISVKPSMCPNAEVTDAIRRKILDMHNERRSMVARGLVKNGRIGNCPTAANMYEMAYNCHLESSALTHAKKCSLSSSTSRQGQGENVYSGELTDDLQKAAETAVEQWWNQIYNGGVNPSMIYRQRVKDKPNSPSAFTQMAWASSTQLGCAVVKCQSRTFTVCRYSAAGNIVDEYVYRSGSVCQDCPLSCDRPRGLCKTT